MAKLIFENSGDEIQLPEGSSIQEACEEQGVPFACTEGVCGTCIVEVQDGMDHLSPYSQEEQDFLGDMGCERMACQCRILTGDVKIKY